RGGPAHANETPPHPRPGPLPQVALVTKAVKAAKPLLGITLGDPAGIGPEVIVKALSPPGVRRVCRPLVIGSPEVLARMVSALKAPLKVRSVDLAGVAARGAGTPGLAQRP